MIYMRGNINVNNMCTCSILLFCGSESQCNLLSSYLITEQLAHPILDSLRGGDKEWIINLLYAFNSGTSRLP